jgi:hypothetical protein
MSSEKIAGVLVCHCLLALEALYLHVGNFGASKQWHMHTTPGTTKIEAG